MLTSKDLKARGYRIVDGIAIPPAHVERDRSPGELIGPKRGFGIPVDQLARLVLVEPCPNSCTQFDRHALLTVPGRPIAMKVFRTKGYREYREYVDRVAEVAHALLLEQELPVPVFERGWITYRVLLKPRRGPISDHDNWTKMVSDAVANRKNGGPLLPDDSPKHLACATTGEIVRVAAEEEQRLEVTVYEAPGAPPL